MRFAKVALVLIILGPFVVAESKAFGATAPVNGTIKIWSLPSTHGTGGKDIITGVIGDYGRDVNVNAAGKPTKTGSFTKLILKKGMILLNTAQLDSDLSKTAPTDFSTQTCSGSLSASSPVPIVRGTKAYRGIQGSLTVTVTFAFVSSSYTSGKKKGQCNTSIAPNASRMFTTITGSGTVTIG